MSRGGSYGGGQSSLGYLFGRDQKTETHPTPSMASTPTMTPPYGIDIPEPKSSETKNPPPSSTTSQSITSHNYPNTNNAQCQNFGISLSGRPSTKVRSAPGGDSSLGYLFKEDKSA